MQFFSFPFPFTPCSVTVNAVSVMSCPWPGSANQGTHHGKADTFCPAHSLSCWTGAVSVQWVTPPPPHPGDNFSYAPTYLNHTINLKRYVLFSFFKSCAHVQFWICLSSFAGGGGGGGSGGGDQFKTNFLSPRLRFFPFLPKLHFQFLFSFPFLFLSLSLSLRPFVCRL